MANEFKHVSVGTEITQAEYEGTAGHVFNSQATGDIMYASSSSQLTRLGIGSTGAVLTVTGGVPVWDTTWSPAGDITVADTVDLLFGTGADAGFRWSTGDADNHSLVLGLDNTGQQFHITDQGAIATDWNRSAGTHPEVSIHSNTTPATDYLAIGNHDGTTASIDVVGGTTLSLDIAGNTELTVNASGLNFPANSDIIFGGTTGTNDITLTDSLADALSITRGGTDMVVFNSSTPSITFTPVTTFTGAITASGGVAGDLTGDVTGTADVATVATTVTITDNESTSETNAVIFTAGGDVDGGNLGLESDGDFTYNPGSGTVAATTFSGALSGNATTATALASGRTIGMTGDVVWTSASFDGSGNVTGAGTIQANAVETAMINTDAVTSAKIADDAITSALIADDAVVTASIADDAITSALIADDAVVTAAIADNAITNALMADDAIDSDEIAAGAIDTAHIADNQVTLAKMAGLARGKIIYGDASGDPAALAVGTAGYVLATDNTDIAYTNSLLAADYVIGEDAQTKIDFETNNEIHFDVDNAERVNMTSAGIVMADDTSITFGEAGKIDFGDEAPDDNEATGIIFSFIAGASLAVGDVVYMHTDGEVAKADADAVTTMPAIGICVSSGSDGSAVDVMVQGIMHDTSAFPSFTVGNDVFVSTDPGLVSDTAPSGSGDTVQKVGVALHADMVYFNFNTTEILLS